MDIPEEIDAYAVNEQLQKLKIKYSQLELKKKEVDLGINKDLTELRSLRDLGKQWKDAAKAVYVNVYEVADNLDTGIEVITEKCTTGINEAEDAIQRSIQSIKKVKKVVAQQQRLIKAQQKEIALKTKKISDLEKTLQSTSEKLKYLSENTQKVADDLCSPMREQVTNTMFLIMKEKVLFYTVCRLIM